MNTCGVGKISYENNIYEKSKSAIISSNFDDIKMMFWKTQKEIAMTKLLKSKMHIRD